ncbi:hypothetical protein ABT255_57045 [Streptomyces mirabilis]|uniref:hypothetical protein n=1 Tax=Streptomyces TaxID=1883 RepID=UPI000BC65C56|nr:hypothetical protein [Streptomyces sp. OK228]SOE31312.1 hypothetical protein SAMN05442782_8234 [Streptomyces sp. OK228]
MTALRCEATRWALDDDDDFYPGWVEVRLTDAHGRQWVFFDKPPIFGGGDALSPSAAYPIAVTIGCTILSRTSDPNGSEVVTVSTGGRPETTDGDQSEFDVRPDQLVEP